ncbi:MAG: N-acetyltransferase family protein [Fimbriimonadaceae bacterium]
MEFSESFREVFSLPDGREIVLRPVVPGDKARFVAGLKKCSERTIYNRFLGSKPRFSPGELIYLTECDPLNHVAIVGIHGEELVAVGRVIRYKDRSDAADIGIIVEDTFQRNGIGPYLLSLLLRAAVERGIVMLCGDMFASNHAMFRVIDELPFNVSWSLEGSIVHFEIDLTPN